MAGLPENDEPRGYHLLADLMGQYSETGIFRRFGDLNMLNILSLQAELIDLRVQFRDAWGEDDASTDPDEKMYSTYFRTLIKAGDEIPQLELLHKIRNKLKLYNDALIQAAQIRRLPQPDEANTHFLRDWLSGIDDGRGFLSGHERWTWGTPPGSSKIEQEYLERDLVTIHAAPEEQDMFSKFLTSSLLDFWTWLRSCCSPDRSASSTNAQQATRFPKAIDPDSGLFYYSEAKLLKFNNIFISVIGATLPVVAIVALYFINTEGGRIGAMAGFTVVFALSLAIFTNARRLEIAASTAAFAAVEVVFIGSELGKS